VNIGDLVRYAGWKDTDTNPLALIIDVVSQDSSYHNRVRVIWLGEDVPVQASAISTTGNRISSWVHPKNFILINSCDNICLHE